MYICSRTTEEEEEEVFTRGMLLLYTLICPLALQVSDFHRHVHFHSAVRRRCLAIHPLQVHDRAVLLVSTVQSKHRCRKASVRPLPRAHKRNRVRVMSVACTFTSSSMCVSVCPCFLFPLHHSNLPPRCYLFCFYNPLQMGGRHARSLLQGS